MKGGETMKKQSFGRAFALGLAVAVLVFACGGCEKDSKADKQTGAGAGNFKSNGERIFFTATSQSGKPITPVGSAMIGGDIKACADCHGADGKGKEVNTKKGTFTTPDIRYASLTSGHEHHGEGTGEGAGGEPEHPSYTDETIKRAITQGLDESGDPLSAIMPRWSMSEDDLDDLLKYLKTLK
jgi:cytochrome c oxidase subunit 2